MVFGECAHAARALAKILFWIIASHSTSANAFSSQVYNLSIAQRCTYSVTANILAHNISHSRPFHEPLNNVEHIRARLAEALDSREANNVALSVARFVRDHTEQGLTIQGRDVEYVMRPGAYSSETPEWQIHMSVTPMDHPIPLFRNAPIAWFDIDAYAHGERLPRVYNAELQQETSHFAFRAIEAEGKVYVALGGKIPDDLQGHNIGTALAAFFAHILPEGTVWLDKANYPDQIKMLFEKFNGNAERVRDALNKGTDGARTFLGSVLRNSDWVLDEIAPDGTFTVRVHRNHEP